MSEQKLRPALQYLVVASALKGLKSRQWAVLTALARHADDYGLCYPSTKTLAEITGLSERTVQYALIELEDNHYLTRIFRPNRTTIYTLTLPGVTPKECPSDMAYKPDEPHRLRDVGGGETDGEILSGVQLLRSGGAAIAPELSRRTISPLTPNKGKNGEITFRQENQKEKDKGLTLRARGLNPRAMGASLRQKQQDNFDSDDFETRKWRNRLRAFLKDGFWVPEASGRAKPGERGCQAPERLMREMGVYEFLKRQSEQSIHQSNPQ